MSSNRERGDAYADQAQAVAAETKPWQGTNFWIALGLAVGSIWGLNEADVTPVVTGVFGIFGGIFAIREKIKSAAVDWLSWIKSPNTWNYVFAVIGAFVTSIPSGIGAKVAELMDALIGKNWALSITLFLSLLSMLFFTAFRSRFAKK